MRKILLVVIFTFTFFGLTAQSKLGLKFSPAISSNRISLVDSVYDAEPQQRVFKFSVGLIYDHEITESYFLSTGLIFVPKYVGVTVQEDPQANSSPTLPNPNEQDYRVNYLQIPVSLKLFTNEIQPDMRVYFQVGAGIEVKVFDEPLEENYQFVEKFSLFEVPILGGAGIEYRAGLNTTLFGGVTYQRGLINVLSSTNFDFQEDLEIRNTVFSVDLGIKF